MTKQIWRTIVIAGAMLGTAHADPTTPKDPPAKNSPVDQKSPDKPGDKPVDKAPAEKVPPNKDPAKPTTPAKDKPVDKKAPPTSDKKPTEKKADAGPSVGRGFALA